MKANRQTGVSLPSTIETLRVIMTPHEVTMSDKSAVIDVTCKQCNVTHTFALDKERYVKWQTGTLIQQVFPEMDADTRELLISGICSHCFDKLFSE